MSRAPQLPWLRVFALCAALLLVALGGLELGLAAWGVQPSLRNKPSYWVNELERALAHPDPQSILLIGSSRVQNGVDPELLAQELGVPTFNISISGAGSLEVLQHVAHDTAYRGVVLVELWPIADLSAQGAASSKADRFIEHRRSRPPLDPLESQLEAWAEGSLRLLHPSLNSLKMAKMFAHRRYVIFPLEAFDSRRFSGNAYDRLPEPRLQELQRQYERWAEAKTPAADLQASFAPFAASVRALEARGARVFIVHPRISGPAMAREQRLWPRELAWDPLIASLNVPSLHYQDAPALMALTCPDHVHLNHADIAAQTRAIATRLRPLLTP